MRQGGGDSRSHSAIQLQQELRIRAADPLSLIVGGTARLAGGKRDQGMPLLQRLTGNEQCQRCGTFWLKTAVRSLIWRLRYGLGDEGDRFWFQENVRSGFW